MYKFLYLSAITVGISVLSVCATKAQDTTKTAASQLSEVVVSANKAAELRQDVPQQIRTVSSQTIAQLNAANTADVLQNAGLACIQKSQQGGGSVTLRGFEANKVLFVVDGVRMNNAIYRAGHLQNIITLDANMLDHLEVLYGAGSTIYGSDAIGGVVSVFTKNPQLGESGKPSGNAFVRYATANGEKTAHVDVNFGGKKWAAWTSVTASDFGDLRKGANYDLFYTDYKNVNNCTKYVQRIDGKDSLMTNDDVNVQRGAAYQQLDLAQKILFKPNTANSHLVNLQYSTSSKVPRYDRLQNFATSPSYAEWYYGPQNRLLASYRFAHTQHYAVADKIVVTPAYQNIGESRYTRRYTKDALNATIEQLNIGSLNVDVYKTWQQDSTIKASNELTYGAEVVYNSLVSVGESRNIIANTTTPIASRYPNGQYTTAGFYASHHWSVSDKIVVSGGLRYTLTRIEAQFSPRFYDVSLANTTQQNDALTWNIGATANLNSGFWLAAMLSTAFRAPNIDDMGKTFDRANGTIIIPNPTLRPERIMYKELSLEKRFGSKASIGLNVFHGSLSDAIAVKAFSINGSDSTTYNSVKYKAFANTNIAQAETYGGSLMMKFDIDNHLTTSATATYTRGNDLTYGGVLDHISPIYGNWTVTFREKTWDASFYTRFNGWKHLSEYYIGGEDNEAFATPDGTPAWATANLSFNKTFALQDHQSLRLQIAAENILDSYYRTFSSGISAPGRNFIATVRYSFS
ncbi:MAG: hypothetical protein RI894_1580 [Bacteroidota bacterium]|jgi:hemoglobin/transferrin/lactoferrin receptor protein